MAHKTPLLVIGHKNPDTDSICSAIAYARYKSEVEHVDAVAVRAGNVNAQTRFALESFQADTPAILTDVYPRIRDIMIPEEQLILVKPTDPIAGARSLMLENRFSFLPVSDRKRRCKGRLTAVRLAALMDEVDPWDNQRTTTADLSLLADLAGPCTFVAPTAGSHTAPTTVSGTFLRAGQPGRRRGKKPRTAILFGPATEILAADGSDVSLAIAAECGPDPAPCRALQEWADSAGVPVLALAASLPHAASMLRLVQPVSSCLEEPGPTFRADTTLREALREVNRSNEGGFIVLDAADRICGVVTRINFMTDARFRVALVDHNELSQAVDGIEHAHITEIIDHHRIGAWSTSEPITFVNRAVGSTCTIIGDLYRQSGEDPSRETAGLLLSGVLSDTVILRSPTTTPADRAAAEWLSSIAGVTMDGFGEQMFEAGSQIRAIGAREILERDMKYYEEEKVQFSVSQVEMTGFKVFWDRSEEIAGEVGAHRSRAGLDFACLMVTDITHGTTLLVVAGDGKITREISYPQVADGVFEMNEVLSRKKQVLPYLAELVRSL